MPKNMLIFANGVGVKIPPGQDELIQRQHNRHKHPCKDSPVLGEVILTRTALDACERLLKPGGCLIPCSATLYGQLVECPGLQDRFSCFNCGKFCLSGFQLRNKYACDFLDTLEHKVLSSPTKMMFIPFDQPKELRHQLLDLLLSQFHRYLKAIEVHTSQ